MNLPNLALPLFVMLIFTYAEIIFIKQRKISRDPWRDVVFNLNSGHVLMWLFRGVEVAAYAILLEHYSLKFLKDWPIWQLWIFGFIVWDFCFYWMHRLHHKIPFLWAVHIVHHQGEHFNLSLGIRNSWYSSISNFPFVAGLAILGLPVEIFVMVSSIHYAIQFYNHNSLITNSGVLDTFMVTPLHHRVHHGMDEPYLNKNFGGTFLLWDKIFATHQVAIPSIPVRFGTSEQVPSSNPYWASNLPLMGLFKLHKTFKRSSVQINVSEGYIARAGFILFSMLLYYVLLEVNAPISFRIFLFVGIFIGTIGLGAASDGQIWGMLTWFITPLMILIYLPFSHAAGSMFTMLLWILLTFQVLDSGYQLLKSKKDNHEIG